ncbi:MAG: DUF5752 family protein [bacterium]|nr:DUF5752 family protein [candidate division WOR-3 bacterium]
MSNKPFHFHTRFYLVKLLGDKAKNPAQLLDGIKKVPISSIYYHTHRFLQQHHYLSPEPPNDFAYWLSNILNLKPLGESFASVDVVCFKDMEALRAQFVKILNDYLAKGKPVVDCPAGYEFHFMGCLTFVLPTPHIANNRKEFAEALSKVSINSLYFHIFEARMRLCRDENDFAAWFKEIGETDLAKEVAKLDPYTITLEGLREKIIKMVHKYGKS